MQVKLGAHAYDMHVWELFEKPNPEALSRKNIMIKKLDSNNQTCLEHKKNYKTNLRKHA